MSLQQSARKEMGHDVPVDAVRQHYHIIIIIIIIIINVLVVVVDHYFDYESRSKCHGMLRGGTNRRCRESLYTSHHH